MHVRMARYKTSGDINELIARAEEGMLPLFEGQPGFKAYSIAVSGDEIFSFSVWDSAEEAEAANEAAAGWVAENMAGDITIVETNFGELLLSTTLGVSAVRAWQRRTSWARTVRTALSHAQSVSAPGSCVGSHSREMCRGTLSTAASTKGRPGSSSESCPAATAGCFRRATT